MTATFPLAAYREGIAQVTVAVFDTMLGMPVRETAGPWTPSPNSLTGAVYYSGAWKGALFVECTREQAMEWTAHLMSLAPPISPDDARDGLGEMTNVIAGNLKPLLPPGVALSLPSVVQGSDYSVRVCGQNLSETLRFEGESGGFRITLVEVIPGK